MRVSSMAYVGVALSAVRSPDPRPARWVGGSRAVYGILNAPGNDFGYGEPGDVAFLARCNATTGMAQWRFAQSKSDKMLFLLRKL